MAHSLGDMIYSEEKAPSDIISKAKNHVPRIEAPDRVKVGQEFQLKVSVGPHPSTVEHSIRWIEIYLYEEGRVFNPIHIARIVFEPGYTVPEVVVKLRLQKKSVIYAVSYCNQHGLWEARKEIDVE